MSKQATAQALLESLLYAEESDSLDFKQAQYPFVQATDAAKAELLKDILAFANSWRRVDAYIVIGVRDIKGGRGEILGVADHLDDANIQQFVNSKTQRPVQFSYRALEFENKQVALIHIPVQDRPVYLKTAFAQLKGGDVLVRRGSSTAVASPDEIAQMGRTEVVAERPDIEVYFADPHARTRSEPSIQSVVLDVPARATIPSYRLKNEGPFGTSSLVRRANSDYYRDLVRYTQLRMIVQPLFLAITNSGGSSAQDVRIQISIPEADSGVIALDGLEYPHPPRAEYDIYAPVRSAHAHHVPEIFVSKVANHWLVEARIEKVQPKATVWLTEPFYLGAEASRTLELRVQVFADNLPRPHEQTLQLSIESTPQVADLARIKELESDRFAASAEYKRMLDSMQDRK